MSLATFVTDLFATGRARVPPPTAITAAEREQAEAALRSLEAEYRPTLAGSPPVLHLPAALWAATRVYRGCQLLVFRELGPDVVAEWLGESDAEGRSAEVDYAVDLTLRFLPDLSRQAIGRSEGDPLVDKLQELARHWPLSSVGMGELGEFEIGPFAGHPTLLQLYVDRVLEQQDLTRLGDARVRQAVQQVLGLFPELAPQVAARLDSAPQEQTTA